MSGMRKQVGHEAVNQVRLGFREGRDPYGKAWEPLKLRAGTPLRNKGILGNSFSAQPDGDGFAVVSSDKRMKVHQKGMTIVPKTAKALRFRGVSYVAGSRRRANGSRIGNRRVYGPWIFRKKVVIPARPMIPEPGTMSPIWAAAFHSAIDATWKKFWRR